MKQVAVIIPVSEFEATPVVLNSAQTIVALDHSALTTSIVYAIDSTSEDDERVIVLKQNGVDVLPRQSRGKRAGAINDALRYLADFKPDYVALFDVDSRPERNFLKACINALEQDPQAYIASSRRYISNPVNLVSRTIQAEYYLLNLLLRKSAFKQFNGLIGVLRADLLYRYKLNEAVITEDADYATRLHAQGYNALLVTGTKLYEQAPVTWQDLVKQRTRWYYGGLQLWRYWNEVKSSKNRHFIRSWVLALTITYCLVLFLPIVLFAPFILRYYSRRAAEPLAPSVSAGFIFYILILQYAAIIALVKFVRGRGVEWQALKRVTD
ncbi:MAG: glycosyltransferase family 2 protein [Methanophagales archaeon ANME-1-THS]|nr:MAG: glycosyltransferase family 2 protein [Methanophagales archaeon ANME-1-THS]